MDSLLLTFPAKLSNKNRNVKDSFKKWSQFHLTFGGIEYIWWSERNKFHGAQNVNIKIIYK